METVDHYDLVTGHAWRIGEKVDVVMTTELSQLCNHDDAVGVARRYEWWEHNPWSLATAKRKKRIELTIQVFPLVKQLPTIWREGRTWEKDKTANDLLPIADIRNHPRPLNWYLEIVLFHDGVLETNPLVMQGLIRGLCWIIKELRPRHSEDMLLALPSWFKSCPTIAKFLTLSMRQRRVWMAQDLGVTGGVRQCLGRGVHGLSVRVGLRGRVRLDGGRRVSE